VTGSRARNPWPPGRAPSYGSPSAPATGLPSRKRFGASSLDRLLGGPLGAAPGRGGSDRSHRRAHLGRQATTRERWGQGLTTRLRALRRTTGDGVAATHFGVVTNGWSVEPGLDQIDRRLQLAPPTRDPRRCPLRRRLERRSGLAGTRADQESNNRPTGRHSQRSEQQRWRRYHRVHSSILTIRRARTALQAFRKVFRRSDGDRRRADRIRPAY